MTDSGSGATSRKGFIAAATALGAAIAVPSSPLQAAATPTPTPAPTASPPPSPASEAIARTMRRFDSSLTDEQLMEIARGIDDQNHYASFIRKRQPLHNGDEPAPEFEVR
ncbi:MAG TPA: hypothetical protein VFN49_07220 [Candidatus Aquilonibacter sp.]|nr:hypothetical protein [Candidatus Aquilonibacter sp.]